MSTMTSLVLQNTVTFLKKEQKEAYSAMLIIVGHVALFCRLSIFLLIFFFFFSFFLFQVAVLSSCYHAAVTRPRSSSSLLVLVP